MPHDCKRLERLRDLYRIFLAAAKLTCILILPDAMLADAATRRRVPLCRNCRHHYITHDPRFPYGCRSMGFSSKRLPCQDVQAASGRPCLRFHPKAD